jgi:hypothetical protein
MRNNGHDLPQDPALDATVAEIARSRQRLTDSLGELREEITQLTDWQEWVRRKPYHFVIGAFLVGYWLGSRGD